MGRPENLPVARDRAAEPQLSTGRFVITTRGKGIQPATTSFQTQKASLHPEQSSKKRARPAPLHVNKMRLSTPTLSSLLLLAFGSTAAAAAASASTLTTTITLKIPPSHSLPNPGTLPPNTHATLSTLGRGLSAPLSTLNTFVFRNVSRGSYLVDVHCASHAFAPLRLDVLVPGDDGGDGAGGRGVLAARAWETFRGNEWDNKGEALAVGDAADGGYEIPVRVAGVRSYYVERSSCEFLISCSFLLCLRL